MHRFLRNFRATPHTTTKIPPATALFGQALKTKLRELKKTLQDPAIEENDRKAKSRMKRYADSKTYVQPSTIQEGDTVFVKRDDSKRKRDTPYRPDSYVVVQKKGSMVTARNDNATINRNSSCFKKAPSDNGDDEEASDGEDAGQQEYEPNAAAVEAPESRYPRRVRKRPTRYGEQFH
ncbi:Hypothetical predicted protein [Paramuricea clavata]|uniref:Uncharacterized protein n=1 Tax=Paramuricea clavata TaxID=317549 RepID=A0A7D9J1Y8_PARCT|nr:Hypothetical predicted protein [Paramuricea clavata]